MDVPTSAAGTPRKSWLSRVAQALSDLGRWPWGDTLRTLAQRFREDRLGVMAGSLTFTTLISLVPLITVMLAVFTAFPMFSTFQGGLERFLLQNLVPDSIARPVLGSLTLFAAKASRIGTVGLVLLLASALALMLTIDRTLNAIWRVPRPRPFGQRLLIYWAALTFGPLLLGASLTLTSWALSASRGFVAAMPGGVGAVVDVLQFALLAAAAAGLFHYVPNTHVRAVHAWSGGLFVALVFEGAKEVLAWYVRSVPTISAIYGAFATLPILLLWIYLVWVIVLLGAVIAAYAPSLSMRIVLRPAAPGQRFILAVEMLGRLEAARHTSTHGLAAAELAAALRADPLQVEPLLDLLVELGWVGRLDEPGAPRHVLLADPALTRCGALADRLLLEPAAAVAAFRERAGLSRMTLAEVIG
ncbi:MAG: YihY family inner membrane protein [Rubrivivax sp.]